MNYALYYPTIEFEDYAWLWSASLLWDRIYRIVPEGYEPSEPENVRILTEDGDIGISIRPSSYAKEVAQEFITKVESREWPAAALECNVPEVYARIHKDKVDVELRNLIVAKGGASAHGDWLHVPTDFEALYMTFLAERISRKNNLQLLSGSAAAWTGATYFKYDGQIEDYPREELTHQLAALVIRDFIPQDVLQIRPHDLVKFRKKYRTERQRFLGAIRSAAKAISESEDKEVYQGRVEDLKKEIGQALSDYKASLQALKIVGWTGIKSISFPVVTKVAAAIAGTGLDATTLSVVSALGIGVGLVSGLADLRQKRNRLDKDCDFSYLLHLNRNWKQSALYKNDYNYFLCRSMEEFIND